MHQERRNPAERELLIDALLSEDELLLVQADQGTSIHTKNGITLKAVEHVRAFYDLQDDGLLRHVGGQLYRLTKEGRKMAEQSLQPPAQVKKDGDAKVQGLGEAKMGKIRVLFLAANPEDTKPLALDEEIREIEAKVRASEYRDSLDLIQKWAVRPDDLQQALLQHKPHIVHFSGHGTASSQIVLKDAHGKARPVSEKALVGLFTTLKDNVRVVVLNACYSKSQAEAVTQVIDCVIGMSDAIGDAAAIKFAAAFYRAIGFDRSVKDAFDLGVNALQLDAIPGEDVPQLLIRKGVDPAEIHLLSPQ